MNYIKLSIMCSFLMGLSLPHAVAMEVISSSEEMPKFNQCATTHYTPPSYSQQYLSTQEYSQNTQNFLSGSGGVYSQGSSYDSQSSQGTLPAAEQIFSLNPLKKHVERLIDEENIPPENLCFIFDFHGVWVEQERHKLPLTLKGNIIEILDYLQEKRVPYLVATAWDNFNEVIRDGSKILDLEKYCGVTSNQETKSEKYFLGHYKNVELEGYRNGNFVALRYPLSEEEAERERSGKEHYYYGQKAFSPELVYPDQKVTHLFFVDDSQYNIETFRIDFEKISGKPANLYLYRLDKLF